MEDLNLKSLFPSHPCFPKGTRRTTAKSKIVRRVPLGIKGWVGNLQILLIKMLEPI